MSAASLLSSGGGGGGNSGGGSSSVKGNHKSGTRRSGLGALLTSWTRLLLCRSGGGGGGGSGRVRTVSLVVCLGTLLAFLSHRYAAYVKSSTPWIAAPINEIDRTCPAPSYETISNSTNNIEPSRICITTLTDAASKSVFHALRWRNFDNLLELTMPNKQQYADLHGYLLFDESTKSLDRRRPPSWSKIRAATRLLEQENCEWVLWLDADTVIMNMQKRLEAFLPTSHDLVLTRQKGDSFNAGAWAIRNTPWSRTFLHTWYYNFTDFVKPPGLSTSGDNDALKHYLRVMMPPSEFATHIAIPPRCQFNSDAKWVRSSQAYQQAHANLASQPFYLHEMAYHRGDLIAHVAGVDNKISTTQILLAQAAQIQQAAAAHQPPQKSGGVGGGGGG